MRNIVASTVGAIGLVLLTTSVAFAQDDADAELDALEQEAGGDVADAADVATAEEATSEAPAAEGGAADAPAAEAEPEQKAAAEEEDEGLDVVEVTVDRRKKDLQDYSGVAASFSEKKLSTIGINNARDLSAMVPGLQIGVQEGNTEIYIRGVGSDNNTELGDPAVALHIDGVYIPRPRGVGSMFFDISRVEVSSGPQGTLRGRNAMGGTVNIVSNRPKLGEFEANAEATFGTFAQRRYQGMVNIPIGDTFAVRLAGFSEVHDPYYQNVGPVQSITAGENADAFAYRVQAKYEPTDKFSVLVGYDITKERGTGYTGANYQGPLTDLVRDEEGEVITPQQGIPFDVSGLDNPRTSTYRGAANSVDMTHQGARILVSYDAGPVIVDLSGSYRDLTYLQRTGSNAGANHPNYNFAAQDWDVWGGNQWDSNSQSMIGELRIYAPDDARLRWTLGGFAFDEQQQAFLGLMSDPANGFGGGEFNMPDVQGSSLAGYADATFDVTEDFRLVAGVRVTREDKSRNDGLWMLMSGTPGGDPIRYGTEGFEYEALNRTQYALPADYEQMGNVERRDARVNNFLAGVRSFGSRDDLATYLCNDPVEGEDRLDRRADGVGFECAYGVHDELDTGIFDSVPQDFSAGNTFFDWRAGVEYDLNKDSMVYLMATTGHKGSGFNDTVPAAPDPNNPTAVEYFNSGYNAESVLSFEVGTKNLLLDRRLKLNATAFAYVYEGLQFQTLVALQDDPDPDDDNFPPTAALRENAKASSLYGVDVDFTYRLPAGLEAEIHVLYMDGRFNEGTIVNDSRISFGDGNYQVDLGQDGGNTLPRVSPFTINYTLSQVLFTDFGSFNWLVQGQTRAQHYMTVFNGEGSLTLDAVDEPGNTLPTVDPITGESVDDSTTAFQRLTDVVPTYTRFDLGLGWKHPDGRIAINAFVNNATNIAYATSIISTPGLNLRFYNPPRTAGVRFRVEW